MLTVVHAELAEDIVCSGLTVTIVGTSQLGSPRGNRRKAARRQKRIPKPRSDVRCVLCPASQTYWPANLVGPTTTPGCGLGCMSSTQFSRVTGLITAVTRTA